MQSNSGLLQIDITIRPSGSALYANTNSFILVTETQEFLYSNSESALKNEIMTYAILKCYTLGLSFVVKPIFSLYYIFV